MLILELKITLKIIDNKKVTEQLKDVYNSINELSSLPNEIIQDIKPHRFGLESISCDYLNQYFLFIMGMLHHHLSKDGSEADLQKAKDFYIKSFSWGKIEKIDNKLYKRALKDLKNLSLNFGV